MIRDVKRISTEFQFYKDCLVIKMTYKTGSCQLAVPALGNQMAAIFRAVAESHKNDD